MIEVCAAAFADIPAIEVVCAQEPNAPQWPRAEYEKLLHLASESQAWFQVAKNLAADVIGFCVARQLLPGEWELESIVVVPSARRQGAGVKLMSGLIARLRSSRSVRLYLEVRASNLPAQGLYERFGLLPTGRRKNYYTSPAEDAVLYTLHFRA